MGGLFADHEQGAYTRAVALVEQTLRSLNIALDQARVPAVTQGARFAFRRGSAQVEVWIEEPTAGTSGTLRVLSPVVMLPEPDARPAFFERLLKLNAERVRGAAFALVDDRIVVVGERSLTDLDPSEVSDLLSHVGEVADDFDDRLAQEFGTTRCSDLS